MSRAIEHTAQIVRTLILDGRIPEGSRIRETELSSQLGVGRGTLRSALHRLAEEQLVRRRDYRDTHVTTVTETTIRNTALLRGTLDGLAGRLAAARKLDNADRARLMKALEALDREGEAFSAQAYERADWDFHRCVIDLADNTVLAHHYDLIVPLAQLIGRRQPLEPPAVAQSRGVHRELARAILDANPDHAERLGAFHASCAEAWGQR